MWFKTLIPLVVLVSLGVCLAEDAVVSDEAPVISLFQRLDDGDSDAFDLLADDELPESKFREENMQDSSAVQEAQENFVDASGEGEEVVLFKEGNDEGDDEEFRGKNFLEEDGEDDGEEFLPLDQEAADALMDRDEEQGAAVQTRNRLSLLTLVLMTVGAMLLFCMVAYVMHVCSSSDSPDNNRHTMIKIHATHSVKHYVTRPENMLRNSTETSPLLGEITSALLGGLGGATQPTATPMDSPPAYSVLDPNFTAPGVGALGGAAAAVTGGLGGAAAAATGGAGAATAATGPGPMNFGGMLQPPMSMPQQTLGGQLPAGFFVVPGTHMV